MEYDRWKQVELDPALYEPDPEPKEDEEYDAEAEYDDAEETDPEEDASWYAQTPDILKLYFNDVGQIPLLTNEEEKQLIRRMKSGDKAAQDAFVQANLRLVISAAKPFKDRGLPFLDLVQEGNIGLMRAAEKYDERFETRFSTYAMWWIREKIRRELAGKRNVIYIPQYVPTEIGKIRRVTQEYAAANERTPTAAEIAKIMKCPVEKVEAFLRTDSMRILSLEAPLKAGEKTTYGEFVKNESSPDPQEKAEESALKEALGEMLKKLEPREATIVRRHFGLGEESPETLEKIGQSMNLTRERVRQIEAKAVRKLRALAIRRGLVLLYH